VLIIHEVQHANDPSSNNKCDEATIQAETAAANCLLAGEVVPGSTAQDNLCKFYEGHREYFNDPEGPMQDAWDGGLFGIGACSGDFPSIPPCPSCP